MATKAQPTNLLPDGDKKKFTYWFWGFAMFPFVFVVCLLLFQSEDSLPPVEMLDNPPELQASVVYATDSSELGKYFLVNRTSVEYRDISPFVTDALISTEDERFKDHAGVDFRAVGRAVFSLGGAGGASTISQQLAKLLYTLQQREREELARARGERLPISSTRVGRIFSRINEKARENIIAIRLEKRYTKEEIIKMYLNQFDFLYNAVGIENAAKVYFNKKPKNLAKEEAAMLVGMCKNPALYNPYSFKVRNYRGIIASEKEISPSAVTKEEILARRAADSTRALNRRNQVLYQWLKNSKAENDALRTTITQEEYDALKVKPLVVNYQSVDHKQGIAPYLREYLRKEVTDLLLQKNEDGSWKYARADGTPYDIYRDGLQIYTTIDANLQKHAEAALTRHLKDLQKPFDENNKRSKNFPFSNQLSEEQVKSIMRTARLNSPRYAYMSEAGYTEQEIVNAFNTPTQMKVFSWNGDKDTLLSPNDSIRYYKSFLHAGLLSIEPQNGHIKAWVGGANISHFAFDHVKLSRRQVGSTIKPFVYAAAIEQRAVKPCTQFANTSYCVDLQDEEGNIYDRWCPKNAGGSKAEMVSVETALAQSMNNITVGVMSKMGNIAGPQNIAKLLRNMDINISPDQVVPSMCLGVMDLSLFEMVGAQCIFANQGIYTRPTAIICIKDRNGNVIYDNEGVSRQALNENVAFEVVQMMKKVVQQGTAGSLYQYIPGLPPTAGKTGTTQSNADGWFMGLTPKLVTGVWVGAEDRGVRFNSMQYGQGARLALPIYGYYMKKAYDDPKCKLPRKDFEAPPNYDPKLFSCDGEDTTIPEFGL